MLNFIINIFVFFFLIFASHKGMILSHLKNLQQTRIRNFFIQFIFKIGSS